jgi:hypothetical protein
MATITAAAGGGNWNDGSTWVGGVAPLTTDSVILNGTSGQVTVSNSRQCVDINFSGYTNTITFSANLTITGNLTRSASVFSYAGTGGIIIGGTTTQSITTANTNWDIPITIGATSPQVNLLDTFKINALLTLSSTTSPVITRNNVFDPTQEVQAFGNITIFNNGTYTGSAAIKITGTATQTLTASGNHQIRNNLTIDKSSGVLNLSGTLTYNTGTLTYVASGGTVNAGSSTLNISASTTLNTNGINWNNVTFSSSVATTITLTSDWNIIGILTINNSSTLGFSTGGNLFNPTGSLITGTSAGGGTTTLPNNITITNYSLTNTGTHIFNSNTIFITGNINITANGVIDGTTLITMSGTGTWSRTVGQVGRIVNNLTIDTLGTITISGTVTYGYLTGGKTLTYLNGTVNTSGSTLDIAGNTCTFNTSGMTWGNVSITAGTPTITLNSDFNVGGNFTTSSGGGACTINGLFNINVSGNLLIANNGETTGTSTIRINGTGSQSWTHSSTQYLSNNLIIDKTSGVLTIGANVYYRTRTLTFVASGGTVDTTTNNSRLNSNASTTFVTDGIVWNNATFSGTNPTFTLTNNFTLSGTLTLSGGGTSMTINNSDINVGGLLVTTTPSIVGSSIINFTGTGTWNHTAAGYILKNININTSGTLTLGANIYYSVNTITYISGTVDSSTNSNTLNILLSNTNTWFSVNLDTAGMSWYNIALTSSGGTARTFTLTSDLSILNTFSLTNGGVASTTTYAGNGSIICNVLQPQPSNGNAFNLNFNNTNIYTNDLLTNAFTAGTGTTMNSANLYISRNIRIGNSNLLAPFGGTVQIYYVGSGTWTTNQTVANQSISANFTINTSGVLTLSGNVYFAGANTFTYRNGKVNTKNSTLNITGNSTFVNCNKINFDDVVITAGNTITMNEFFNGSPELQTIISSTSTTNYTIAFTDNFEKIAKFVNVNNCTLSRPQQLLMLTNTKKSSTNARGTRYNNQSPNGIAKNDPSVQNQMTYSVPKYLVGDPNMTKSI